MGRHAKPARQEHPTVRDDSSPATATGSRLSPRPTSGFVHVDEDRREALLRTRLAAPTDPGHLQVAVDVVMLDPAREATTDRRRLACLVALLARDAAINGGVVDATRALQRDHVDRFVRTEYEGYGRGTITTYRSDLYRYGRRLHPMAYPRRSRTPARPEVQPPYSAPEVSRLWTRAESLTPPVRSRMRTILACGAGAGARPDEMPLLRGSDVIVDGGQGCPQASLRLTSRRHGGTRTVPILEVNGATALSEAATAAGPAGYLLHGRDRRNAVSKVNERLRLQDKRYRVRAPRLRHYWIVSMASTCLPTALLLQFADLHDSHTLADLQPYMRPFTDAEALAWVREVGS